MPNPPEGYKTVLEGVAWPGDQKYNIETKQWQSIHPDSIGVQVWRFYDLAREDSAETAELQAGQVGPTVAAI